MVENEGYTPPGQDVQTRLAQASTERREKATVDPNIETTIAQVMNGEGKDKPLTKKQETEMAYFMEHQRDIMYQKLIKEGKTHTEAMNIVKNLDPYGYGSTEQTWADIFKGIVASWLQTLGIPLPGGRY